MCTRSLLIVAATESFGELWPTLASKFELELQVVNDPTLGSPAGVSAVILNAAGAEGTAIDLLSAARSAGHDAPIVVGAEADHRLAVELMRRGAAAYYALPEDVQRLEADLARRCEHFRSAGEEAERTSVARTSFDFSAIIGEDPGLLEALDLVARVIPNGRTTVLITGETGTGKELVAQAIHANGPRAGESFVAVNCSAIPANLLESELFGHEKGAFTGASAAKPGLFELADGGTLFLDELSLLPLELQGKLLRVLETREVRRVGGTRDKRIDVRVLAAANADLEQMVESGELREDLYYRLAVILIHLPPLRDRGDDVILLARRLASSIAEEYGLDVPTLSDDALTALRSHSWPGNVRELRNAIERALLLSSDSVLRAENLVLKGVGRSSTGREPAQGTGLPFPMSLAELEREAARRALELADGNKSGAARLLGITRKRLYRLLAEE
ncbi:MAG: sigma-54 dependent transcriptional regulator [Gemmatimonadota bacterium]